jgi:hypothetical protein
LCTVLLKVRSIEVESVNRQLDAGYMVLLSNLGYSASGVPNLCSRMSRLCPQVQHTLNQLQTLTCPAPSLMPDCGRGGAELRHLDCRRAGSGGPAGGQGHLHDAARVPGADTPHLMLTWQLWRLLALQVCEVTPVLWMKDDGQLLSVVVRLSVGCPCRWTWDWPRGRRCPRPSAC